MHLEHTSGQLQALADMDRKPNCTLRVDLMTLDPNEHEEVGCEALEFESMRKLRLAQCQMRK